MSAATSVVGHYELLGEFAAGGMASVHFGRLVRPGGFVKTVVIKRLKQELAKDPTVVEMLLHEARVTGVVEHPNVVSTLDVVTTEADVFIVMEYVRGDSLANLRAPLRARDQKIPPRIAAALLANVLHGLHAAHEATDASGVPLGIVHRDVSPQNVLVGVDGIARIADFGVAKSARAADRGDPTPGHVVGKLAYLAPEAARGEPATPRTDVYGAGIVLWEALTGRRLFTGEGETEILDAVLTYVAPPPSRLSPDTPSALDEVALRALERDPERRFATAREMAIALEAACPPALASEVAAWVAPLVGPVVDRHGALVAAAKDDAVLTFAATDRKANLVRARAAEMPAPRGRGRLAWLVPLVAGALAVGIALGLRARRPPDLPAAASLAPAVTVQAPPASAPGVEPPAAQPLPTTSAPPARTVRRRIPHPSPAASIDCTKKFTIDAEGHTIFRKECL